MNPSPEQLALQRWENEKADRARSEHRARLHNAAVARRKKAKRGGKR